MAKLLAPSDPELASVTMPNGAKGSVVPGLALQSFRHCATSACISHE